MPSREVRMVDDAADRTGGTELHVLIISKRDLKSLGFPFKRLLSCFSHIFPRCVHVLHQLRE